MRRNFFWRILAITGFGVAAVALLTLIGIFWASPLMRRGAVQTLVSSTDLAACNQDPSSYGFTTGKFSIFAYDRAGRSAHPAAPPLEPGLLRQVLEREAVAYNGAFEPIAVTLTPVAPEGPCAILRMTSAQLEPSARWLFLGVLATATLTGMALSGLVTFGFVLQPLRARIASLSQAAGGVGRDTFLAPDAPADALGHIAAVLTESHHRIVEARDALERRNRALEDHLAGIAHDLRTPLSSLQLALESVATEAQGDVQPSSRRALADVVYLSALVENLHHGTRLRQNVDVGEGRVDLTELVERLENRFRVIGRHAGVEVAANIPERPVWVACTPALAERAVANLVQNAIEHNHAPGHVAIVLTAEPDDTFELAVLDDGPGLPEPLRATLAKETFLTDEARPRGPGLGMLITSEVARRAGWSLNYEPLEPSGVRAVLRGPRLHR